MTYEYGSAVFQMTLDAWFIQPEQVMNIPSDEDDMFCEYERSEKDCMWEGY